VSSWVGTSPTAWEKGFGKVSYAGQVLNASTCYTTLASKMLYQTQTFTTSESPESS